MSPSPDRDLPSSLSTLAGGGAISFLFGLLGYAFAFLTSLVAARFFGPTDYGLYALAVTFVSIAGLLALMGLPTAIVRFIPYYLERREDGSLAGFVRFAFAIPLILSISFGILLFLFAGAITAFFSFPPVFISILRIVGFIIPFRVLSDILGYMFIAQKRVLYNHLRFNLVEKVVLLVGLLLVVVFKLSIAWFVAALAFSVAGSLLFSLGLYRSRVRLPSHQRRTYHLRSWLFFSVPLLFSGLFSFVISWIDRIMIGKFMTAADVGIYTIAFSMAAFLSFFQSAFSTIFISIISTHYARGESDKIAFLFRKAASWIFGLSLPIFLILLLYSRQVLTLFYGQSYAAGYLALIVIAFGFLVNLSTGLNKEILFVHAKTRFILFENIFIASFAIIANFFFIPRLGILGAAIAACIAMALDNIICLLKARQYERLKFDLSYSVKFFFASIISLAVAFALLHLPLPTAPKLLLSGASYLLVYVFALLPLRVLQKEEVQTLLDLEKGLGLNLRRVKRVLRRFAE